MRAAPGAIEIIKLDNGDLQVSTIDNEPAVGICGSGILDAVAQLYSAGILDRRGRMADAPRVQPASDGRGKEFLLVPASESGLDTDITVSRGDVSEIQLAKGAMRAGLNILLSEAGLTKDDIHALHYRRRFWHLYRSGEWNHHRHAARYSAGAFRPGRQRGRHWCEAGVAIGDAPATCR